MNVLYFFYEVVVFLAWYVVVNENYRSLFFVHRFTQIIPFQLDIWKFQLHEMPST